MLKRNPLPLNTKTKLNLFKSMVIPVLLYGSACYQLNVEEMKLLEGVQRNACKWIATDPNYKTSLQCLGILPLPMYIQLNNLLLLSKILNNHYDFNFSDRYPPKNDLANTRSRLFECTRPAKFVCEKNFCIHAKRLANLVPQKVDFTNTIGLKGRLLQLMWEHFEKRFDDSNPCSWKILCDCTRNNCRNMSN